MPNRIVREAILTSERIAALAWPEEVFYRRLMSIVDDYGRCEAHPQLLRSKCYPLQTDQVRAADITRWMAACQKAGVILCYEVDRKQYLEVLNFGQQQRSASKCPPPPASDINCYQAPADAHLDVSVFVSVSEDEKAPRKRDAAPAGAFVPPEWIPEDTWAAYLKTRAGKKAKNEPHALGLIVKDLEGFRAKGHDPVVVLNNSIKGGWAGVFEPKTAPQDIRTATVPSAPGRDPALAKLDEDAKRAAPIPAAIKEKLAALKGESCSDALHHEPAEAARPRRPRRREGGPVPPAAGDPLGAARTWGAG